jgi:lipocalin-like protein
MKKLPLIVILFGFTSFHNRENTSPDFVGMWTLLKCVSYQTDGTVSYPYGEHPVGQLFYDSKGNMMVEIMKPGIKKFVQSNLLEGVPDEVMPAYYGFIAYYGTYKVVSDSGMVIHHIKACSFPNWVDEDQKRYYEFRNDQLILRTSLIGSVRYELTWQKKESSH